MSCVRGTQYSVVATLSTVPGNLLVVAMDMSTDKTLSLHSLSIRFGAQSNKNMVAWVAMVMATSVCRCVPRAQHSTLQKDS